tara:strand:+ start:3527 stop:3829 length:303 start_codon:yes stop_codon:yes gene_type:complete
MNDSQIENLNEFLTSGEYLPPILRDFHAQKNIFKCMHHFYQDNPSAKDAPNWVNGQIYTIDWFLWFMASRGYTLQKSRKKIDFKEIPDFRELLKLEDETA